MRMSFIGGRASSATACTDRLLVRLAVAAALLPSGAFAAAAENETTAGGLSEIVVTAERRESNLQTTPIAVTAIDSAAIQQLAPVNLGSLAQLVPNFSANKINGFNAASFAMRGVGNTDIIVYNEAPVSVLVDDFVMPSVQTQLLDPFDVESVQVLRGPQGTLFGKNTTGGAVIVRTKAPSLTQSGFEAQALAGSLDSRTFQGAANLVLMDNQLAARLMISREREDGWMKNGASDFIYTTGQTYHGDGRPLGGTDVLTLRGKLLWQPMDSLKVSFTYELLNDRSPSPGSVNVTPNNIDTRATILGQPNPGYNSPYFAFAALGLAGYTGNDPLNHAGADCRVGFLIDCQNGHHVDADGYHLNIDWTTPFGAITWVQGYRSQDSALASNYTGVVGPVSVFDANRSDRRKTWQEEARLASNQIGPFNYVAGLFYQHDDTKFCVAQILGVLDLFGLGGGLPGGFNNNPQVLCNGQTEKSAAAYGEGNYKITDSTTLTVGARVTRDSKDWAGRQQVFVQALGTPAGAAAPGFDPAFTWDKLGGLMNAGNFSLYPFGVVTDSHTWTQPTYRVTLSHEFNPTTFGYFNYSHGFRAGGYNDQVGTGGTPISKAERSPTNPEKADSFELGAKLEVMDRRLRLNEALFYVKYKDAIRQVVQPVQNAAGATTEETVFRNAAKLTVYGIENELTAQLAPGLLLRVPLSYQHCKYDEFRSINPTVLLPEDLSSLDVNRCPKWTATADLNYVVPLPGLPGQLSADVAANYVSKNLDTYSVANPFVGYTQTYAEARTLMSASITYNSPDDHWFVRVLGRNLTDKHYIESAQNVDPLWIWAFYGEPRVVAAQVGVKFSTGGH